MASRFSTMTVNGLDQSYIGLPSDRPFVYILWSLFVHLLSSFGVHVLMTMI